MFGITLATGLVVDDAIVVIENVQRHINEEHSDPHTATSVAMAEVTSAVIATSLVLISVFVPVSFFPGTTGILYKQFSLTIAFSIAISAFNALTLSPALAAIFLRSERHKRGLLGLIERGIVGTTVFYGKVIRQVLRARYVVLLLFVCGLAGTVYLYNHVPSAFLPSEDQNYLMCIVQTPPGASLTYTSEVADQSGDRADQERTKMFTERSAVMGFSLSRRQFFKLRFDLCAVEVGRLAHKRKVPGPLGQPTFLPTLAHQSCFGVPGGHHSYF